jgi:hypothetical protein
MTVQPAAQTEQDRVFASRMHNFLVLGFNMSDANRLAGSNVDWHEVERLLRAGCPLDLALKIVL